MSLRSIENKLSIKEVPIIFNERRLGKSKMSKRIVLEALMFLANNFKLLQKIQDNKFTHDNLNDVKNLLKLNKAINNKKVKLTQTELKAFDSLLKS